MAENLEVDDKGLKRKGSWKRFKESVKETVQGWVGGSGGGGGAAAGLPDQPGVPSAVFPDRDVSTAVKTDVEGKVLKAANCYSGGGPAPTTPAALISQAQTIEIPTIVVTEDGHRSPTGRRRTSPAVHIRPAVSTPDVGELNNQAVSSSLPHSANLPRAYGGSVPPSPTRCSPQSDEDEDEAKRRMAVMKIKQAIMTAASEKAAANLESPAEDRRLSDTSPVQRAKGVQRSGSMKKTPPSSLTPAQRELLALRRRSAADAATASASPSPSSSPSRSSSMKKPKSKPMIWEHFEALPNTNLQGKCKACHMNVSCKFNTGNFVRHLQLAHMDIYRQYQSKMENQWTKSMLERNLK